jgi:hypothetical protein
MAVIVISASIVVALLAALLVMVRRALSTGGDLLPLNAEWIDELSIERYRPMMRLLDESDVEFLRSQPGFTPRMAAALRTQKERIFRGYLRCLCADFHQVCTAVKVLMLQSRDDRPDLASALVRAQATFATGILVVQVRLFFWRWGLCAVDLATLVRTFDSMRVELQVLVPAGMSATA